jgi:putative spermidine/putrescine transport system ATP-binding protein
MDNVSLEFAPGEFVTLLGPSGSGKTTAIMAIAGFVDDIEGEIWIDDRRIDQLPIHNRNIGVVFQHLALFPHMTVRENVAFPLRMRGVPRREIAESVERVLDLVHLSGYGERLPAQLSGGQQQRVAFARAIVFEPKVLLLDEPLSALDKKLRESMQYEIKRLHHELGITVIHVTHDQAEALAMSDRIVVINEGQVEQVGAPSDLYYHPSTEFVADFVGESTLLDGTVSAVGSKEARITTDGGLSLTVNNPGGLRNGTKIGLVLRPERVLVGGESRSKLNSFTAVVEGIAFHGDRLRCQLAVEDGTIVLASIPSKGRDSHLRMGEQVPIGWDPEDMMIFDKSQVGARPARTQ